MTGGNSYAAPPKAYRWGSPSVPLGEPVFFACGKAEAHRRVLRDSGVVPLVEGPLVPGPPHWGSNRGVEPSVIVPTWAANPLLDWHLPGAEHPKGQPSLRMSAFRLRRLLRVFAARPELAAAYATLRQLQPEACAAFAQALAPKLPRRGGGERWRPRTTREA